MNTVEITSGNLDNSTFWKIDRPQMFLMIVIPLSPTIIIRITRALDLAIGGVFFPPISNDCER